MVCLAEICDDYGRNAKSCDEDQGREYVDHVEDSVIRLGFHEHKEPWDLLRNVDSSKEETAGDGISLEFLVLQKVLDIEIRLVHLRPMILLAQSRVVLGLRFKEG